MAQGEFLEYYYDKINPINEDVFNYYIKKYGDTPFVNPFIPDQVIYQRLKDIERIIKLEKIKEIIDDKE